MMDLQTTAFALLGLHVGIPLTYYYTLKLLSRGRQYRKCNDTAHGISVIIPVVNETEHLRRKLSEVCSQIEGSILDMEIIIVSAGVRSKEEIQILKEFQKTCNIKYFTVKKKGKIYALNYAIQKATKDLLLFTDVDSHNLTPPLIEEMVRYYGCDGIALVSLPIKYIFRSKLAKFIEGEYFNRAVELQILESKLHSSTVFTGSCMLISKKLLQELGGFPESVGADDTFLAHRVSLLKGLRSIWLDTEEYILEYHDENFWSYLKKKARRAQHLAQAFLKSLTLVLTGKAQRTVYLPLFLTRAYLILMNPFLGLISFTMLLYLYTLPMVSIIALALLTRSGRAWITNQVLMVWGLLRNLKGKTLSWK